MNYITAEVAARTTPTTKKWLALIRVTANGVKECAALYFYEQPDKTGRGRLERDEERWERERKGKRVRGGIMQAA